MEKMEVKKFVEQGFQEEIIEVVGKHVVVRNVMMEEIDIDDRRSLKRSFV